MTNVTASVMNLIASASAAIATVVLAIFAKRQWNVMKENNEAAERQNELVRDHWKREDATRAEENRPKAAFWLEQAQNNDNPELWCANIGSVNFIVSGMQVKPLQGEPKEIRLSRKNCLVIPVGQWRAFS